MIISFIHLVLLTNMPNHKEHCEDSLRRYGKTFSELHKWMDEPSTILGPTHRKYRHDPHSTPPIAGELFGPLADQACLDHIRLDELESRRKGIGRTPIGRVRQTQIPNPLSYGLVSLMFFIVALYFASDPLIRKYSGWMSIPFFIFSFILFIAFIGSLLQPKGEKVVSGYTIEWEAPKWETIKTCSKCGTKYNAELEKCPNCGQE